MPLQKLLPWISALLSAGSLVLSAQGTTVTVHVRDSNGTPIAHAVVAVGGGQPRVTDDSGRVSLGAIRDSITLSVRRMGYKPFFGRVGLASGQVAVSMHPLVQTLSPVEITGQGWPSPLEKTGFYDRIIRVQRGAFSAEFITPEELDSRRGVRTTDLFFGRRFVNPVRTGTSSSQTYLLGRGGCKMSVFIDGILQRPEMPRGGAGCGRGCREDPTSERAIVALDDLIDASVIAAVEIYQSAANAPAEMIPLTGAAQKGACGIVAIWTGGRR